MATITVTGTLKRAIRNLPMDGVNVRIVNTAAFGVGDILYLIETSPPIKVASGAINGTGGIGLIVPTAPDAATYAFGLPRDAQSVDVVTLALDDSVSPLALEDAIAGGSAGTGGTITVSGLIYRPFSNLPYVSGVVRVSLTARFVTEDGVFLAVTDDVQIKEGYLNGEGGLVLYVPDGQSEWLFTFPDGSTATAYLGTHTNYVEIADIANGDYATALTPMDAPTAFSAVQDGVDVDLVWNDETGDETLFRIERSDDDGATWETVTTTAADAESYTDTSVPGGEYIYRIRAEKSGGQSAWVTDTVTIAVAAPTNLVLTIGNSPAYDEIDVTWDAVAGADDYDLEYSDNGTDWSTLGTTASTTYTITSSNYTVAAEPHYVRVRAANTGGESNWTQGTIAGWKVNVTLYANLNEASGNRATQAGGATLTDNNTVGSIAGVVGNAALFNSGNSEYLDGGDIAVAEIGAGDFSISLWNRIDPSQGTYGVVIGKDVTEREWVLYWQDGANKYVFNLFDSSNSATITLESASGLSKDVRRHIMITRNGSTINMYLDNGTPTTGSISGTPRSSSTSALQLGRNNDGNYLYGDVDELAICKGREWTSAQRAARHNSGNGTTY